MRRNKHGGKGCKGKWRGPRVIRNRKVCFEGFIYIPPNAKKNMRAGVKGLSIARENLEESQNADHEPPQEEPEVCIDNSLKQNKKKHPF